MEDKDEIFLGFAEKTNKKLTIADLPSKIGGLPLWLFPIDKNMNLTCSCGNPLALLMQVYAPLENIQHAFHRMLYIFFCKKCWVKKNVVKVLRMQLPENNKFFDSEDQPTKINVPGENEQKINDVLSKGLVLNEFTIENAEEKPKASEKYYKFYSNIDERSNSSCVSNLDIDYDSDVEDELTKKEKEKYEKEFKEYTANNPGENIMQITVETVDEKESDAIISDNDPFFELFRKVTSYDSEQVLRYHRKKGAFPLWFTNLNMYTVSKTKCKKCGGNVVFEMQVMPYIFMLEREIADIDIGTIVIYTCENSCGNDENGVLCEEYGFIQRTGEKGPGENVSISTTDTQQNQQKKKEEVVDEEGFVEVKKKKKKKKPKDDDEEEL